MCRSSVGAKFVFTPARLTTIHSRSRRPGCFEPFREPRCRRCTRKCGFCRSANLQTRLPSLFSRAFHRCHRLTLFFQVLEFRRIVIAHSPVAHQLLLEDPENRRCASNRIQFGQAASKCRNGALAYGLSRFSPHGGTAEAGTRVPAVASVRAFHIDGKVKRDDRETVTHRAVKAASNRIA